MADRRAQSLYHDEGECRPLYFREFVERAGAHGLQYLGEADFFEMHDLSEPPEIYSVLHRLSRDAIEKEQYLDFLKRRRFRQTLLCHAGIALQRQIPSAAVKEFWIARSHRPAEEGQKLPTEHPVASAIVAALDAAWPGALNFDELRKAVGAPDPMLADLVLAFYACDLALLT